MKVIEYGRENSEVVLLLHGGGLSWWNYREEAELLQGRYRVVLPLLDGHADSDAPFTTIRENARELSAYIDENFQGRVAAIGGLSLGGQLLVELLTQRGDICRCALIESALVLPMPRTAALLAPHYGLKGVWVAMAVELTLRGSVFLIRLWRGKWMQLKVKRPY